MPLVKLVRALAPLRFLNPWCVLKLLHRIASALDGNWANDPRNKPSDLYRPR